MSSFNVRASIVAVGLVGFALGAVVRGDGLLAWIEGDSIVVDAGREPLLVVGGVRSDKSPIAPGFQVFETSRVTVPRDAFGRVVVFKMIPVAWCNSDVCEPCKPGDPDPYACTVVRVPLFNPIVGAVLEPPVGTPKPTEAPFATPTATATATPTQSLKQ